MEIDIPGEVKAFLDEVVDSFVMWDLLIFCSKKSEDMETPSRVAQLLGRSVEELNKPVQKLEKLGLVNTVKQMDGEIACQLNKKSKYFTDLERFWAYNENQEHRLRILSYLLQKKIR